MVVIYLLLLALVALVFWGIKGFQLKKNSVKGILFIVTTVIGGIGIMVAGLFESNIFRWIVYLWFVVGYLDYVFVYLWNNEFLKGRLFSVVNLDTEEVSIRYKFYRPIIQCLINIFLMIKKSPRINSSDVISVDILSKKNEKVSIRI